MEAVQTAAKVPSGVSFGAIFENLRGTRARCCNQSSLFLGPARVFQGFGFSRSHTQKLLLDFLKLPNIYLKLSVKVLDVGKMKIT